MHYIAEDPWPLAGALGLIALGLLVALKVTQQGKYLVRAGIALGLAVAVVAVERVWVTEDEKIERVVYDLAEAVQARDADRIMAHLAPEASVEITRLTLDGPSNPIRQAVLTAMSKFTRVRIDRDLLEGELQRYQFDWVRISHLQTNAGSESGRGTAEFRVHLFGEQADPYHAISTPPAGLGWSLGFRRTDEGQWKVSRITPTALPGAATFPGATGRGR